MIRPQAMSPAEHAGQKRPRPDCTAYRCYCKWLRFQASRANAKLVKGTGDA